ERPAPGQLADPDATAGDEGVAYARDLDHFDEGVLRIAAETHHGAVGASHRGGRQGNAPTGILELLSESVDIPDIEHQLARVLLIDPTQPVGEQIGRASCRERV